MSNMYYLIGLVVSYLSFFSVAHAQHGAEKYRVVTDESTLAWEGHKFFGGKHTGNIVLQSGELTISDEKITGGSFVIDMNSIIVTDLQGETAVRLANHLKDEDFFDAENFPTASFVIRKVEYANPTQAAVLGELTLRGTKQEVAFLADIQAEDNTIRATARDVRIDRTIHGSRYGSIRFFDDLGRKIVSDIFTITIDIIASR